MKLVVFADMKEFAAYSKELVANDPKVSIKAITPSSIVNWPRVAMQTSILTSNQIELLFIEAQEVIDASDALKRATQFTVYWRDGKRSVLNGGSIEEAFRNAGYGGGAVGAVDFYSPGDNHDYEWNAVSKEWDRKEPLVINNGKDA